MSRWKYVCVRVCAHGAPGSTREGARLCVCGRQGQPINTASAVCDSRAGHAAYDWVEGRGGTGAYFVPVYSVFACAPHRGSLCCSPRGVAVCMECISELGVGEQGRRVMEQYVQLQILCSAQGPCPHPTHTLKRRFLCQPGLPIPAAQQKACPHLAFARSGLVTMQSPSQRLPLPWPLCFGRCEILIASLGTGLFLSVVSDQNIILSCKYNYRGGGAAR